MMEASTPAEALARVAGADPESTLIIDLDHTLHLGNSTEDFIAMAVPATIGATILAVLEAIRPWRRAAEQESARYRWRFGVIACFMPWTIIRWRRVKSESEWNSELLESVRSHPGPVVVASNGYRIAVTPRVRSVLPHAEIVARSLRDGGQATVDKLPRVVSAIGLSRVSHSTMVSDSLDDLPILEASANPVFTEWPESSWEAGLGLGYVPLRYTVAKHGPGFVLWGVVIDDVVPITIAIAATAVAPLGALVATAGLTFAVRCVYDLGYHENDHLRPPAEIDPRVSERAAKMAGGVQPVAVAFWATVGLLAAGAAVNPHDLLVDSSAGTMAVVLAAGAAVLVGLRVAFAIFNRLTRETRRWIYPIVQLGRYGIYSAVLATPGPARVVLLVQGLYRWGPYLVYRNAGGSEWPIGPWALARFVVYLSSLLVVWPETTSGRVASVAVAAWFAVRSRGDLALISDRFG